jgi:PKD repeat protein
MKTSLFSLCLFFMILLSPFFSKAQCSGNLVQNGNFSNGLTNWQTFNGFVPPPLIMTQGCLDTMVVLRAFNMPPQDGDGMFQTMSITADSCYDLCLCMGYPSTMTSQNNVQIWAATNSTAVTYSSLMNNTYPAGSAELIGIIPVNFPSAPQQYCISGWVASANYTRLIIFNSCTAPTSEVLIDNICLKKTNLCAPCISANINAGFTYSANGTTVTFANATSGNTTGMQYAWNFNDTAQAPNDTSSLSNPTFTFSAPGIYMVCLKASGYSAGTTFLCQDSFCMEVVVPNIVLECDTTGNGFTFTLTGSTAVFSGFSNSGFAWSWDFGDPASGTSDTSSLQNPSHTFSSAGLYKVCLIISYPGLTGSLCRDTICQTIAVGVSSLSGVLADLIRVFPNPVQGSLNISLPIALNLELIDIRGRRLSSSSLQAGNSHISLEGLPAGIYILRLTSSQGEQFYYRIVKEE